VLVEMSSRARSAQVARVWLEKGGGRAGNRETFPSYLEKEDLVLLLEREGESVDDGAEDLQQLRHPVVPLRLVDEVVEDIVNLLSEESKCNLSIIAGECNEPRSLVLFPPVI
jgi:hypothetical protein